jgi:hypothetical protein
MWQAGLGPQVKVFACKAGTPKHDKWQVLISVVMCIFDTLPIKYTP